MTKMSPDNERLTLNFVLRCSWVKIHVCARLEIFAQVIHFFLHYSSLHYILHHAYIIFKSGVGFYGFQKRFVGRFLRPEPTKPAKFSIRTKYTESPKGRRLDYLLIIEILGIVLLAYHAINYIDDPLSY